MHRLLSLAMQQLYQPLRPTAATMHRPPNRATDRRHVLQQRPSKMARLLSRRKPLPLLIACSGVIP